VKAERQLKMKRSQKIAIALLMFIGFGTWLLLPTKPIQYIQTTTGIFFPKAASDIDVYDNGENYIVAHLMLSRDSLPAFMSAYPFVKQEIRDTTVFGSEQLNPQHQQLPQNADVYSLEGRSAHNRWEVILDRNSGQLLVSVLYPDFAGDEP
jgi:hypothetical protein